MPVKINYTPNTESDIKLMLKEIGVNSVEDLLVDIPEELLCKQINIPTGMSEMELKHSLKSLSDKNANLNKYTSYLGAGAYEHFVPSVVDHLSSRGEFYTCYTPYQPEVSQGTLQGIYEFQSMMCELLAMDIANASMYDGASALAEAAVLAIRHKQKRNVLVSKTVHPEYREVLSTYLQELDVKLIEIEMEDGITSVSGLESRIDNNTACVLVQTPNFFGCLEETEKLVGLTHKNEAIFVACVNPMSLGIIKPPGEYGVDVAVGDIQPLGNYINYGGPHAGFFAVSKEFMRKMPGRLAGATTDTKGRRAFTLTLQTREQHIRRAKATSNICTNQQLLALRTCIYLSTLGKAGMIDIGNLNIHKSHYAIDRICELDGIEPLFDKPFFNEFAIKISDNCKIEEINRRLFESGIIGGLDLSHFYPDINNAMLLCVTETKTKEDIDNLVSAFSNII
ncbi:MAG: putative glycine dehydrogenase (decarboxylating) subunit 1 [Candidatus Scalindua arabica]|uniref:Probable glycine dehydrogenase (decarboxylating) subunit 1 n=1 Tax=Candidatus Scalindua arabica TaxID=1127984 RepID=A0A941W4V7_9BACT|nr:putative glycine dehydrogenase (decarboxylating) subunit 1 [Candidatus Scalindua arabica]